MDALIYSIPISLFLGAIGLVAFVWTLRNRQYDDPKGDSERILSPEWDEKPKP
jgi:cbb3-type cytochrome oxidase maturation protein